MELFSSKLPITRPKPQELVPFHPVYNVQDWDAPAGAIDWRRMIDFLRHVKSTGVIPEEHYSHDHLNEQKEVRVASEVKEKWRKEFERIKERKLQVGERVVWGLVDGFLLYWHPVSIGLVNDCKLHTNSPTLGGDRTARRSNFSACSA